MSSLSRTKERVNKLLLPPTLRPPHRANAARGSTWEHLHSDMMARKNPADVHRRKREHKKKEHEGRVTLEDAAAGRDPARWTRPAPQSIAPPITRLTAIIKINPGVAARGEREVGGQVTGNRAAVRPRPPKGW